MNQLVPHAENIASQIPTQLAAHDSVAGASNQQGADLAGFNSAVILRGMIDGVVDLDLIPQELQHQIQAEADSRLPINKQAWLARGVGLSAAIRERFSRVAQNPNTHLVSTDHGFPHASNNIHIALPLAGAQQEYAETADFQLLAATLYDTDFEFPEIIRIAWLITRRSLRLSNDGQNEGPTWRADLAATYFLMKAADDVDLLSYDSDSLQRCLRFLQISLPDAAKPRVADLSKTESTCDALELITANE